ncbi:MAG: PGF-CTERM sorting domain-containing protein [Candidatus Methanoperedens sp.]|nr:PGF-CTERM sorting domain-containing protein [Candidatus Methanoperedens sp.]
MEKIKFLFVNLLIFVILSSGITPALSLNETTPNQTTAAPTVVATTAPATPAVTPVPTVAKFRVGPTVNLRPVTEVIERNQDGIVELYMDNSDLNDVTLTVEARITAPSGIHVYGQGFALAGAAGVVMGKFEVPPGTARTISVNIKADESARIGSHSIKFTGLYYPGDNKDNYQPLSLTYPVTVKEASKEPEKPPEGAGTPTTKTPGFGAVLAIFGVFAIARMFSRKT